MTRLDKQEFQAWAYDGLLTNTSRGVLAEYIVAKALGISDTKRVEWDQYDLEVDGVGVEVKSAAYVQTWEQARMSEVAFGVRTAKGWDARTNTSAATATRSADVYVFCLLEGEDRDHIDPLELMLTRPNRRTALITGATNLSFLVRDELHTYRGRQSADGCLLACRLRGAVGATELQCIGTSATLAGPGTKAEQRQQVADLATRIFGPITAPCFRSAIVGRVDSYPTRIRRRQCSTRRQQVVRVISSRGVEDAFRGRVVHTRGCDGARFTVRVPGRWWSVCGSGRCGRGGRRLVVVPIGKPRG